jgi:chemotaxis protein MotB
VSAGGFNDRRRRRGGGHGGGHEGGDERWLLTYSDMITLLMALFMVLFSISAVNVSKFQSLQMSLRAAFAGHVTPANKVLPGGDAVMLPGAPSHMQGIQPSTPSQSVDPEFSVMEKPAIATAKMRSAERHEQDRLLAIQRAVEAYARAHGFADRIATSVDQRGLEIRLLTDKAVFASGSAVLEPAEAPLIHRVADLITAAGITNAVSVEGNTDSVPISTSTFRSNWELSTARATAVLEALLADGVPARRLSATGYADQRPVAPNTTAAGRAANRRVDVVLLRNHPAP